METKLSHRLMPLVIFLSLMFGTSKISSSDIPITIPVPFQIEEPLVADLSPSDFVASTYIHIGSGTGVSGGITKDDNNNTYILGGTSIGNDEAAFVMKLNSMSTEVLYCETFLHYSNPRSIAADDLGCAYITGTHFVSKLDAAGNQDYFYDLQGIGEAIDVDEFGSAYILVRDGINDLSSLLKLTPSGELEFSKNLGPACSGGHILVENNCSYIGIGCWGGFPKTVNAISGYTQGDQDGYFCIINNTDQAIVYGTYLGGNDRDMINSFCLGKNGSIILAGTTLSSNFPTTPNALDQEISPEEYDDIFVCVFNYSESSSEILFSTYWGGESGDLARGVFLDSEGSIIVCGYAAHPFPLVRYELSNPSFVDLFILNISSSYEVVYSIQFGGSNLDIPYSAYLDSSDILWMGGVTYSEDFPTYNAINGTYQNPHCEIVPLCNTEGFLTGLKYTSFYHDETPPSISQPEDVVFFSNESAAIEWILSDYFPNNYTIQVNGTTLQSGYWICGNVTYYISGWEIGNYTFEITAWDKFGSKATDTVYCIILPYDQNSSNNEEDDLDLLDISGISVVHTLLIVYLGIGVFILKQHRMKQKTRTLQNP